MKDQTIKQKRCRKVFYVAEQLTVSSDNYTNRHTLNNAKEGKQYDIYT